MAFSADSIRGIIGSFVKTRATDAEQQGVVLPEDLKDTGDVVITTHEETENTGGSTILTQCRQRKLADEVNPASS